METGNWKLENRRLVLIGFEFRFSISSLQFLLKAEDSLPMTD